MTAAVSSTILAEPVASPSHHHWLSSPCLQVTVHLNELEEPRTYQRDLTQQKDSCYSQYRAEQRAQTQASACIALDHNSNTLTIGAGAGVAFAVGDPIVDSRIQQPQPSHLEQSWNPPTTTKQKKQHKRTPPCPESSLRSHYLQQPPITKTDPSKKSRSSKLKIMADSNTTVVSTTRSQEEEEKELQIQQDEIDILRSRVDSVLNQLVQSTVDDTQQLQTQVNELRMGPRLAPPTSCDESRDFQLLPTTFSNTTDIIENTTKSKSKAKQQQQTTITKTTPKNDNDNRDTTWVVDPYGDQGSYQGAFDPQGLPQGEGIMRYMDGRMYTGEWDKGTWHGAGKAVFANQDVFQGMYHQDQRHGYGVYKWTDGRVYAGEFCMDLRQGQGKYSWPDGAHYDGDFHKGLRHGEGRYTFKDGSVYTGEWCKGKYHGVGEVSALSLLVWR
jgi:hypothetical protein